MSTITLAKLKEQVRFRSNMENSNFVTDAELTSYINYSVSELYDILSQKFGEQYFLKEFSFPLVSGTKAYDLPLDFFKVLGVDLWISNTQAVSLERYNFTERNRFNNPFDFNGYPAQYLVINNQITFTPVPSSTNRIRVSYCPFPLQLILDTDVLNGYNGWEEFVIVDSAIKCLAKEESDVSVLMAVKDRLAARIESAASNRDANSPSTISSVRNNGTNNGGWGFYP